MFSPGFVLLFIHSRAFHDDEMNWSWSRKRQLLSVNKKCYRVEMGSLPQKVDGESMNYEDYDTVAVY